jgi:hypothetical protein
MATKIDENMGMVAMGVDDVTGEPRALLVDPVTGRLLVAIVIEASTPGIVTKTKIDQNFYAALLAVDATTGVPRPLIVNPASGALLVSIP